MAIRDFDTEATWGAFGHVLAPFGVNGIVLAPSTRCGRLPNRSVARVARSYIPVELCAYQTCSPSEAPSKKGLVHVFE